MDRKKDFVLQHDSVGLLCCGVRPAFPPQMDYERQVESIKAATAAESDFSVSQAEVSSRQAMLENASDIKVSPEALPARYSRGLSSLCCGCCTREGM